MPRLPNADQAIVDDAKIATYLLDVTHRVGGPKAAFFRQFGFHPDHPDKLAKALLEHARTHAAIVVPSPHGTKYEIVGPLQCPDGRLPNIKSVWIIRTGSTTPRLVTAIPN